MKSMFKDAKTGNQFDPKQKFGAIDEDNFIVYDQTTTSYPLNLPVDYYKKHIQQAIPKEQDAKWFIRPHHVESLTAHPNSIKDDILNTNYYSKYVVDNNKVAEKDSCEEAVEHIEKSI